MKTDLRILVVDDSDTKRLRVAETLGARLGSAVQIDTAVDYEDAIDFMKAKPFDLVILDLLLPSQASKPSAEISRSIIELTRSGKLFRPTHIIGLTEFKEAELKEHAYYLEQLFALIHYDPTNNEWADRIVARITYLLQSKREAANFHLRTFDLDVLVLTARYENEYVPIAESLFKKTLSSPNTIWDGQIEFGYIEQGGGRLLRGAVACIGEMGMAPAAALTAQAISYFRPRLVAMLGMCCGFSSKACHAPRKMLDAIVVRQSSCWEEGRYQSEADKDLPAFLSRSKPRQIDDDLRPQIESIVERSAELLQPALRKMAARKFYKEIADKFPKKVRDVANVHCGEMVSGSSVIATQVKVEDILKRHPRAVGLDMEVFGVYTAASLALGTKPSFLAVKGVADFGQTKKVKDAQKAASLVSCVVFKSILSNIDTFGSVVKSG